MKKRRSLLVLLLLAGLAGACASPSKKKASTLSQVKYLQALGKHDKAIVELKNTLAKDSQSPYAPELAYLIGESYRHLNQTDNAKKAYKKLVYDYSKSPYAALGWRRLAEIKQKRGDFKEAIEDYKHSMQINSAEFNIERCTLYIARVYEHDLKDVESALKEYKKLLRELKNPRIASDAYFSTARILVSQNRKDDARKVLEKLLELYPQSRQADDAKKMLEGLKG